ncbi:hypothetical protein ACFSFY_03875 [Sporosarcina siberiensis]|uniref:YxiS n=1 Tax=Sporosarcina siberiensis TaxID=1365606 RepID=A0ABW4SE40_9BACL
MENNTSEEFIIKKYQEDEQIMIQLFVAWCLNHNLDPQLLYSKAYPEQVVNESLQKTIKEMDDVDPLDIGNETLMDVLQMFGNDELAFVVSDEIEQISKRQN